VIVRNIIIKPSLADIKSFSGKANDIWALGITLYAMIYNELPFWAETELGVLEKIHQGDLKLLDTRAVSDGLKRILLRMLDNNPLTRATLDELKKDPWLNQGYAVSLDSREADLFANYTEEEFAHKGVPSAAIAFAVSDLEL
jgi:serine/threonine protein kinase